MTILLRSVPKTVLVPYQLIKGRWIKCVDVPRFRETAEAIEFLRQNKRLSARRTLEWVESSEPWAIREYLAGIGGPSNV